MIILRHIPTLLQSNTISRVGRHSGKAPRDWKVCGEAAGGQEAVEKVLEHQPDVVILDLAMPFMDGLRAAREITKALPKMPIMLYTLYNTPGLGPEAEKAGDCKVIDKADGTPKLLRAIHNVLKGQPKASSSKSKGAAHGRD